MLRLADLGRLSWGNVTEHKKRSLLVVVTMSVLFGLLFGMNFMFAGLRDTLVGVDTQATDGKVYIDLVYMRWFSGGEEADVVEVADMKTALARASEEAAQYGGKALGREFYFESKDGAKMRAVDLAVAKDFISSDLADVPQDKVPVLVSNTAQLTAEQQELLETTYDQVGVIPHIVMLDQLSLPGLNPLNLVLEHIQMSNIYNVSTPIAIVDDGSDAVKTYLEQQGFTTPTTEELVDGKDGPIMVTRAPKTPAEVVVFDDYEAARKYYKAAQRGDVTQYIKVDGKYYYLEVMSAVNNPVGIMSGYETAQLLLMVSQIVLAIVAVIVATLTLIHLIDDDVATVALYRSLGATNTDIGIIYLLYLLELCLMTIIASVCVGLVIVLGMTLMSAQVLAKNLQEAYALADSPHISLMGLSGEIWWLIAMIIMIAPITLVLVRKRFSAKYVAKKIRDME